MRARGIKPGFFKNELLGTCNPLTTMLFAGLWMLADREGRLEDRPLRIKAEIFPYRESLDINGSLTELVQMNFICRYKVAGCAVIQIKNFRKHQTPHKTEKLSLLPVPPDNILNNITTRSTTVNPQYDNDRLTEPLPPDLLIPDLLIPDSPQQVARDAREPRCDDFFQKCFDLITDRFPALIPCNTSAIHAWKQAGYDFETHIKPTVESSAAKGVKPKSFNYFTSILEDIGARKIADAPPVAEKVEMTPEKTEERKAWYRKMKMQHPVYNPDSEGLVA